MTRLNEIRERLEAVQSVYGHKPHAGTRSEHDECVIEAKFRTHAPADIAWLLEAVRLGNEWLTAVDAYDGSDTGDLLQSIRARTAYRAHVAEQPDAKADNPE